MGFLDYIAGHVGKQGVYPDAHLLFVLILKLSLTVDRPAQQPFGILTAYDAAGNNLSGAGIGAGRSG